MARGYLAAKFLGVIALVAFLPGLRGACIGGPYFEEGQLLDFSCTSKNLRRHTLYYTTTFVDGLYGGSCDVSGLCDPPTDHMWYNITTPWIENGNTTYFRFYNPDRTIIEFNCGVEYSDYRMDISEEQSCAPKFFKKPMVEGCSGPDYPEGEGVAAFVCKFGVYPEARCLYEINGTEIGAGGGVTLSTDVTHKVNGRGDLYYSCWFKVSLKDTTPGTYVLTIILESDPFAAEIENKFAPFTITRYRGYFPGMGYGPHPQAGYGTWVWSVKTWFRGFYQPYQPIMDMGWYPYRGWFPW